jgi:hypothetical protein
MKEEGMNKLMKASLFLFALVLMQNSLFARTLNCKFHDESMSGVDSIQLSEESLILNQELEIPLEKSSVRCGHFGIQDRFDGSALGYQVVLKSCSSEAKLEGHLIDSLHHIAADLSCQALD